MILGESEKTMKTQTFNETKAYAYIGQLVEKEEYDEDIHMIKIQLDEVEE